MTHPGEFRVTTNTDQNTEMEKVREREREKQVKKMKGYIQISQIYYSTYCHFKQSQSRRQYLWRHFTHSSAGQDCDLCNNTVAGSHTALISHPSFFSQHARSVTNLH